MKALGRLKKPASWSGGGSRGPGGSGTHRCLHVVASPESVVPPEPAKGAGMPTITQREAEQVERANASGRTPVVFIHGLWLLPSSWDRWAQVFEEAGDAPVTPGWPDDPETVAEANAHPEVFARKSVGEVVDHFGELIG